MTEYRSTSCWCIWTKNKFDVAAAVVVHVAGSAHANYNRTFREYCTHDTAVPGHIGRVCSGLDTAGVWVLRTTIPLRRCTNNRWYHNGGAVSMGRCLNHIATAGAVYSTLLYGVSNIGRESLSRCLLRTRTLRTRADYTAVSHTGGAQLLTFAAP